MIFHQLIHITIHVLVYSRVIDLNKDHQNSTFKICQPNQTPKLQCYHQYVLHVCYSDEALITEEDLEDQAYVDYDAGGYSPKLLRQADLEIDSVVYDPADDMRKLELARQQVLSTGRVRVGAHFL